MKTAFIFDDVPIGMRLAETIAWCEPRAALADAKRCLRSESLTPWPLARDRAWTMRSVAMNRQPVAGRDLRPVARPADLRGGRLLVYFPDQNLADGAAEVASHGYFDIHNTPPWDTWITLGHDPSLGDNSTETFLLAWVPPIFVDLVRCGIEVNPEECIAWLEDAAINARAELRHLLR